MKNSGKNNLFFIIVLSAVFASQFFMGTQLHGQTVPELITAEELLGDSQLAYNYYEHLRSRFKNNNFEEVIFSDDPRARGPRFSRENYDDMLKTLRSFLALHPEEGVRFLEIGTVQPFRLQQNGQIELLSETLNESWRNIGSILTNIAQNKEILTQSADPEVIIQDLVKQYLRKKDPVTLQRMADHLIAFEVDPARLRKLRDWNLPGYLQYLVLEDIEKSAVRSGKSLDVPGKLLSSFFSQSSLGKAIERSSFFRKGITIVPMTRLEAAFKGIGPGECVRMACNRYFDGLFDDSIHLKILKNGKETGFIGIYKTMDSENGQKYWFIETIQSPFLMEPSTASETIRGLIRHLQQLAILDDSHLAIPTKSFNSYNYKEVVAEIQTIPEAVEGRLVSVKFRNSTRMDKFKKFISSAASKFDRSITVASGYKAGNFTNGYTFNQGQMMAISPLVEQPDWYLQRAQDLLSGKSGHGAVYDSLKLDPLKRAELLKSMGRGVFVTRALFDLRQESLRESRFEEAAALTERIYEALPKELHDKEFQEKYDYVSHRIDNVSQSEEFAQHLKDELFLMAHTWQDYLKIVNLKDKANGKYFAPFLLATLDRFSSQATPSELLNLYRENIRYMFNDAMDLELTRKVGAKLRTPGEFLDLVKAANGEGIRGLFGNKTMRDLYVSQNWWRFYLLEKDPQKLAYTEEILNRVGSKIDIQIRDTLFKGAKNFRTLSRILKLSKLNNLDAFDVALFSEILSDAMIEIIGQKSIKALTHTDMRMESLVGSLFHSDLTRVKTALLERTTQLEDYGLLIGANRISLKDLLELLNSDSTKIDLKQQLQAVFDMYALNEWFFSYEGTDLKNVFPDSNAKDFEEISALAKKTKLRNYFKWRKILKGNDLLPASKAEMLDQYIKLVMDLPLDRQRQVLERFQKTKQVFITAEIPEHSALINTLQKWVGFLESEGESNAKKIIAKQFSLKKSQLNRADADAIASRRLSVLGCFQLLLKKVVNKNK